jgi:hypothetical protein
VGDGEVVEVLDGAALVADEVVVARTFDVKARGAAFDGDLADEAGFDEIAKIVIGGGAGRAGIETIDAFEDLSGSGMAGVVNEEGHDAEALRGAAETAVFQTGDDGLGVHCYLDYV